VDHLIQGTPDARHEPLLFNVARFEHPGRIRPYLRSLPQEQGAALRQQLRSLTALEIGALRAWWLKRMVTTSHPFREKMTLFWHGHFTTGAAEVRSAGLLADQNAMFRRLGTGDFAELLHAVCRDPAMLRYLDNVQSRKEHPNENFARELLELFTMGPGHYTEADVREAARAFTGYSMDAGGFRIRPAWHDRGTKQFLGVSGQLTGDDVVRILLAHPATARFLAVKLLHYFACENPSDAWVDAVAAKLRTTRYDFSATMRAVFLSERFYGADVMGTQICEPAQLVVGTLRKLGIKKADYVSLCGHLRAMGQNLLQPPTVKGWDGGRAWITSGSWFRRQAFMVDLVRGMPRHRKRRRVQRTAEADGLVDELPSALPPAVRLVIPERRRPSLPSDRPDPAELLAGLPASLPVRQAIDHFAVRLLVRPLTAEELAAIGHQMGGPRELHLSTKAGLRRAGWILEALARHPSFHLN